MHWNVILADTSAPAPAAPATTASQGAPAGQAAPQPPPFGNIFVLMALFGVMIYFLMIRPQSQQRKQLAKLMSSLKSGDKVVTSSGIVGVVITVKDKTVSLRSADAKMEVTKSSITEILESSDATPASP